jgi:hypothetical protein
MAEEDSTIPNDDLFVRVTRTADENPTDLNSIMATAVLQDKPSQSHCFLAIHDAWDNIPEVEIDKLVGSFRARCRVCVELRGK